MLRILLDREQQMFQVLKQGIDLQEQQHSLIAFEIHDGLIQLITAARMHLQVGGGAPGGHAPGSGRAARPRHGTSAGRDRRGPLPDSRPAPADPGGPGPGAGNRVAGRTAANLPAAGRSSSSAARRPCNLSRFQETNLFRIVQEALTNAVRHSGAKRIRIEISQQADQVCLEVRDWGRGFDIHAPCDGYGLKGIRYRTRVLQGTAEITSTLGEGTRISVRFPPPAGAKENAQVL